MRTPTMMKAALPAALVAMLGIGLSACSDSDEEVQAPGSSTSAEAQDQAQVTDEQIAAALKGLTLSGSSVPDSGSMPCLVDAVRDAGMSDDALNETVALAPDDLGALVEALNEEYPDDAETLLSPSLLTAFDACVDEAVPPVGAKASDSKKVNYEPPADPPKLKTDKPNLKPTIDLEYQSADTTNTLAPGLAVVLKSFAFDKDQKEIYAAAAECMAGVVIDEGMSDKGLEFLARGPRIGEGSIARHLPKTDRAIWRSSTTVHQFGSCVDAAEDGEPAGEESADANG